ncbi:MAG: hypothetical protein PVH24_07755, partial [Candidatus Zixiibacteriota bacterium]
VSEYGGLHFLETRLPAENLTWNGGNSPWYIATWYVIALATLIEPAFYQRCYAAKNARVARNGIFVSIACWAVFDFLTTSCGLYARAILPDLADPVSSYPALAMKVLPVGLLGMFALALLATVMSTIDSYSFLAASTFGNDIMQRAFKAGPKEVTMWTRFGLVVSALLAVILAIFFRSVVEIWYVFGSIGTPALLVPVFLAFVWKRRLPPAYAMVSISTSGLVSGIWFLSQYWTSDGSYWLSLPPIFPGLIYSLIVLGLFLIGRRERLPTARNMLY